MAAYLRDASSALVRSPCSTSYLVPPPTRLVRRQMVMMPRAAAKEVRSGSVPLPLPVRPLPGQHLGWLGAHIESLLQELVIGCCCCQPQAAWQAAPKV